MDPDLYFLATKYTKNIMNREAGLNLLVHAATEAIQQWVRDIKKMRMGILIVIHTSFYISMRAEI
jgi:hypothetical protein